jgi:hypothetical protein
LYIFLELFYEFINNLLFIIKIMIHVCACVCVRVRCVRVCVVLGTQERELCAVDCLAAYMDLTASRRTREGANIPDRLFLSLYAHHRTHTAHAHTHAHTARTAHARTARTALDSAVVNDGSDLWSAWQ